MTAAPKATRGPESADRERQRAEAAVNPALVEQLHRQASLLNHGLLGLWSRLDDEPGLVLDADEDLFPFYELSTKLLVGLRELHAGAR